MDTAVRTPQAIFHMPQQLVVPIYQRRYVWEEEHQWAPLWQDIVRICDLRIEQPWADATHFLGAVVLQDRHGEVGSVQRRDVIDGQQRLTTLQLLMDATASVLDEADAESLARRLEALTHNAAHFVTGEDSNLKLRHSNRDREVYDAVMTAPAPVDYSMLPDHRPTWAHQFFSTRVADWLGDPEHLEFQRRAETLVTVLERGLELVVINLRPEENSQEIFETLNARGTPLTSADLIKNYVFQQLTLEKVDTAKAYEQDWPFDVPWWESEVSVGRYTLTRGSLFLAQWLGARTGEEVSPRATFNRFKHYVEHDQSSSMATLLGELKAAARTYREADRRSRDVAADLDPVAMCLYRMRCMDTEVLRPALIWLAEGDRAESVVAGVVALMESWLVRRAMLRLPSADQGRVVADVISRHRDVADDQLVGAVETHLAGLSVRSTYWPGDAEISAALSNEPVYRRLRRARLRMFLEAVEDDLRGYNTSSPKAHARVTRKGLPIEHLLPQKWEPHWPIEGVVEQAERRDHVHRLGNLTLLTTSLNSEVSNGPWLGPGGKRAKLETNDVMLMNADVRLASADGWDESRIDTRTGRMVAAMLRTWPVPDGHVGEISDPADSEAGWVGLGDLVDRGLLSVGDTLHAVGPYAEARAVVQDHGRLVYDGAVLDTPSGAAYVARGRKSTNGWHFWHAPDGRRLKELRAEVERRHRAATRANAGVRETQLRRFWEATLEAVRVEHPDWTQARSTNQYFCNLPSGVSGVLLPMVWNSAGLSVQIYFDSGAAGAGLATRRFAAIHARSDEFADALGLPAEWDEMPGRQAARIVVPSEYTDLESEELWPEMIRWLISAQERLRLAIAAVGGVDQ